MLENCPPTTSRSAVRWRWMRTVGTCALMLAGLAATASAQVSRYGTTNVNAGVVMRGVDAAYNPATGGWMVVGAYGGVYAVCTNAAGVNAGPVITVHPGTAGFGAFPRVKYSQDINGGAGGFLVTWIQEGKVNVVKTRILTCGGLVGAEQNIEGGVGAWLESAASIDYSPTSKAFLVAWESQTPGAFRVYVRLVTLAGAPWGPLVAISPGFARDPGVSWNSATNVFGVSFNGESGSSVYSAFARVPAANPTAFTRNIFSSIAGGRTAITDSAYNSATNRWVMTWWEGRSGAAPYIMAAEFDANGTLITKGIATNRIGSYDALSIAYNPVSKTFLLVGVNPLTDDVAAAELNYRGYRFSSEVKVSSTLSNHYPRVASATNAARFGSAFSAAGFKAMATQIVATASANGGPAGAYGSVGGSACPGSSPGAGWTCVNGNWTPPTSGGGSTGGSTGGCPGTAPVAGWVCKSGNWMPPDIAGTTSCPGNAPGAGWTCVKGNWIPPSTGGSTGGSTGCPGTAPVAGWVCKNGNWLPPDIAGSGGGTSCPGNPPGAGWTCVSGNWKPPVTGGTGCPGTAPVAGWVCKNGNWLPPEIAGTGGSTSGCPGAAPGTGWVCKNGNWLPPDQASTCPGTAPGVGWTCKNGNWFPPGYPN